MENRLAASVMKTLVSSIAVQMTTFPIMLRIYGEISLAGFFLNLLVLPTVRCSTGQWNCSSCGWVGIGQCCSLCGAAWKSAAFLYEKLCELAAGIPFCTWIAEVRSCGNVPDIMYCCFWELKFWE